MKTTMTAMALILSLSACATQTEAPAPAAATPPPATDTATEVAERTESERLNAFFEDVFMEMVMRSPQTQTYLGIKEDYDKWNDASDERAVEDFELETARYNQMKSEFDYDKLDESAKLSYRLYENQYQQDKQLD